MQLLAFLILISLVFPEKTLMAQNITEVNSAQFFSRYRNLLSDKEAVVIDGRTEEMFASGHIRGAVNIDAYKDGFEEKLMPYKDRKVIVLYCTTLKRSTVMIEALKKFYKGEIIFITDGITGWKENNLPLDKPGNE